MLASFSAAFDACRDVLINSFIANSLPSFFDDKQCLLNTLVSFIFFQYCGNCRDYLSSYLGAKIYCSKSPFSEFSSHTITIQYSVFHRSFIFSYYLPSESDFVENVKNFFVQINQSLNYDLSRALI